MQYRPFDESPCHAFLGESEAIVQSVMHLLGTQDANVDRDLSVAEVAVGIEFACGLAHHSWMRAHVDPIGDDGRGRVSQRRR